MQIDRIFMIGTNNSLFHIASKSAMSNGDLQFTVAFSRTYGWPQMGYICNIGDTAADYVHIEAN